MAKKIIYVCDKCGSTSEEDNLKDAYEYELCNDCFKKFDDHIKAFFEGIDAQAPLPAPKKEKKAPKTEEKDESVNDQAESTQEQPQRKRIDWDKACALKLAGWSNKAIAEELGANFGSINAGLYSHLDSYCNGERFGRQGDEEDEEAAE